MQVKPRSCQKPAGWLRVGPVVEGVATLPSPSLISCGPRNSQGQDSEGQHRLRKQAGNAGRDSEGRQESPEGTRKAGRDLAGRQGLGRPAGTQKAGREDRQRLGRATKTLKACKD